MAKREFSRTMDRFPLGRLMMTPGALRAMVEAQTQPIVYLARHASGDWGNVDREDRATNDRAVDHGARVVSSYTLPTNTVVWCITESDRSLTTLLLPDEY